MKPAELVVWTVDLMLDLARISVVEHHHCLHLPLIVWPPTEDKHTVIKYTILPEIGTEMLMGDKVAIAHIEWSYEIISFVVGRFGFCFQYQQWCWVTYLVYSAR